MIRESKADEFLAARPIFEGRKEYIPVLAVLDGRFPGKVYADRPSAPRTALVWALGRWAYVEGSAQNAGFTSSLHDLVRDTIFPASLQTGLDWFELYASGSDDWPSAIELSLSALGPERHDESVSVLDPEAYRRLRKAPAVPNGWRLRACDIPIVSDNVRSSGLIPVELAERTSFGYRLLAGDRVIAVCKSTGFESGNEFMVEVETFSKEERGKGYATIVATALIDHALEHGLLPLWETTDDNIPSQRLARKLGFVRTESYPVYGMKIPHDAMGR